ncbi:MAG: ABC transporter permease, partial [Acidobacteria bacterium]|nr:ABC transporter permease [Acidobacteriota bacterium]
MSIFKELQRRWQYWRDRSLRDAELQEELQFHIDHLDTRQKRARFGNATRFREDARDVWISRALDELLSDVKYAIRGLRKSPAFAATAIGTLALGIGAGTAVFSLAQAVLLKPLPYPDPESLVMIFEGNERSAKSRTDTSPATYRSLRDSMRTMEKLALFGSTEKNLTGEGEPERLDGGTASANFFSTIGVQPFLGRLFQAGDDEMGKEDVVVLTYELWERRFASDRAIVGKQIRLNETPHTVIGVLPPKFRFYFERFELWTPFALSPERWAASRGARYIYVTGRVRNGFTMAQVQSELDSLGADFRRDFPREMSASKFGAVGLHDRMTEDTRTSLYFLLAAVIALLLIACSNVANLQLARSVSRGAEMAVRSALGAGRGRLLRQMLTESLVISVAAGVIGLVIAQGAFTLLQTLVPSGMAANARLGLNASTVGIMFGLAFGATLLSGLLPAVRGARSLTTRAIGDRGQDRARGVLIVAEVSLAILLLTSAALLFRTFANLNDVDPGFRANDLLSAQTVLPPVMYKQPALRTRFYTDVLERVRAIPGVASAAYTSAVPTTWKGGFSGYVAEGKPFIRGTSNAMMRQVTSDYFATMNIGLRAGRVFTASDRAGSEMVTVVNKAFADFVWPGEDPIGKRLRRGAPESDTPWIRVVGVVENVLEMGLANKPAAITYFPESQHPAASFSSPLYVVVRTQGDPAAFAPALRRAILDVNPNQTVAKLMPVTQIMAKEVEERRLHASITVAFAAAALLLACLGIYGVLSYAV